MCFCHTYFFFLAFPHFPKSLKEEKNNLPVTLVWVLTTQAKAPTRKKVICFTLCQSWCLGEQNCLWNLILNEMSWIRKYDHSLWHLHSSVKTIDKGRAEEREGEKEEGRSSLTSMSTGEFRTLLFKSHSICVQLNFIHTLGIASTWSALEKNTYSRG